MSQEIFIKLAIVGGIGIWAGWYIARAVRVWLRLRGDRIVTCPETGRPAGVRIDIGHALSTLADNPLDVRLQSCSRWQERGPCEQPCVLEAQQYDSAASTLVEQWARDKACVYCGKPVVEAEALGHHIALRRADGITHEWVDIAAEDLRGALATELPVCWDCHIAETFRREHPELVTDRDAVPQAH